MTIEEVKEMMKTKYVNDTYSGILLLIDELKISSYMGRYVPEFNNKQCREINLYF